MTDGVLSLCDNGYASEASRVRESGGFEIENLSRVPGDACRSVAELHGSADRSDLVASFSAYSQEHGTSQLISL